MKCPKCSYLGFETGDRCRNCGYDFSLTVGTTSPGPDLSLRPAAEEESTSARWVGDLSLHDDRSEPAPESRLPLFGRTKGDDSDEPLIKVPSAPRPPLAVRRTPTTPKLRPVQKPAAAAAAQEPLLEFAQEPVRSEMAPPAVAARASLAAETARPAARASAALVDHLVLLAIDLVVVYFTLRISGLSMADWRALPPVPLAAFLFFVKGAYFCAFTVVGGQTLGKMTAHLQVVTDAGGAVDGARAIKRTLAGLASTAALGLGYLPALFGSDRRALHDRVAGTRVVALPTA